MDHLQLHKVQRLDSISLDETYYTNEGYFIDHPIVTTCGVFEYKNEDGSTRRELRLPEHVFDEKSLKSYKGKPIIVTHDAGEVDKDNVKQEQIGTIMSEGYQDGESVRVEIIIHDTNVLKQCGLKELSLGYSLDTEDASGVWKGEAYDCIQKNIEINHLALVSEARAGESARLNMDSKDKTRILKGGKVVKVNTKGYRKDEGDLSPDEMEAAIALFKAQKAAEQVSAEAVDEDDIASQNEDEEKEENPVDAVRANVDRRDSEGETMTPEEIIAEQKADLEILLTEIDKLQASSDMVGDSEEENEDEEENTSEETKEDSEEIEEEKKGINMDSVDRLLKARLDICRMADQLGLNGLERLSIPEGKKKIIKAVNPKMNLDGKTNSYIDAAYDIAKDTFRNRKSTNDQRKSMIGEQIRADAKGESSSVSARKKMIQNMTGGRK